jgi:hypothetical protein
LKKQEYKKNKQREKAKKTKTPPSLVIWRRES